MSLLFNRRNAIETAEWIVGSNIHEAFQALSIKFKEYPDDSQTPGRWIARGISKNALEKRIVQQPGKFASYGIFFADNFGSLVTPKDGIIYVCDSANFGWVANPSEQWDHLFRENAVRLDLDAKTIEGGYESERLIYERNCVFEVKSGIATINRTMNLPEMNYVLKCDKGVFTVLQD